ncbi:MAG: hypothetical protein HC817_05905 [Saprospiraceae bacterium]|nr:hypothetical protein [Saprospiraceae bacterium]
MTVRSPICPRQNASLRLVSIRDSNACQDLTLATTLNFTVSQPVRKGLDTAIAVCQGVDTTVNLPTLLRGADAGGVWREFSTPSAINAAFNVATNSFRTQGQATGVYRFSYTLIPTLGSSCPADSAVVSVNITPTPIANAGVDKRINCDTPSVVLGNSTSVPGNITLSWTRAGGNYNSNSPAPIVSESDTYTLRATTGACSSTDDVVVTIDTLSPTIVIAPVADSLNCLVESIDLDATGSQVNSAYTWSLNGTFFSNGLLTTVRQGGTYMLQVKDLLNGCISIDSITIGQNIEKPTVTILPPNVLTCIDTIITLDATASASGTTFDFIWKSSRGGHFLADSTTYTPQVDSAGFYELVITNTQNGCKDSVEVEVKQDVDAPTARIQALDSLNCTNVNITLSGRSSTIGFDYDYQWLTDGGRIVSGDDKLDAVIDEPGKYYFIVVNRGNRCGAIDSIEIGRNDQRPTGIELVAKKPSCYGDKNGSLSVDTIIGGTEPFVYSLDGKVFTPRPNFNNLASGKYQLFIQDDNGCQFDTTVVIEEDPEIGVNVNFIKLFPKMIETQLFVWAILYAFLFLRVLMQLKKLFGQFTPIHCAKKIHFVPSKL